MILCRVPYQRNTLLVAYTFAEVDEIISDKLPNPHSHTRVVANDVHHVQAIAWMSAGYSLESVNFASKTATFAPA
jgi:hypothetical protein